MKRQTRHLQGQNQTSSTNLVVILFKIDLTFFILVGRPKTLEDLGIERVNDYSMGGVPRPTGPPTSGSSGGSGNNSLPVSSKLKSTSPGN
jgi:hypothetical protein